MTDVLSWTKEAWSDYVYWQDQDKKTLKRINKLIADTQRLPFEGIGKPEPLKENWGIRGMPGDELVLGYKVEV